MSNKTKHFHCVLLYVSVLYIPWEVGVQRKSLLRERKTHKSKVTFPAIIKERPTTRLSYQQCTIHIDL